MAECPAPLTPEACDLRGYDYFPVKQDRLFKSDFWIRSSGVHFKIAFRLWGESWTQVPAGSLPNDDHRLAYLAGMELRAWKRARSHVLHGFIECNDGRLYHPLMCELALEAWAGRLEKQKKGSKGGATKAGKEFDDARFVALEASRRAHLERIVSKKYVSDLADTSSLFLRESAASPANENTKPSYAQNLAGLKQRKERGKVKEKEAAVAAADGRLALWADKIDDWLSINPDVILDCSATRDPSPLIALEEEGFDRLSEIERGIEIFFRIIRSRMFADANVQPMRSWKNQGVREHVMIAREGGWLGEDFFPPPPAD